MTFINKMVLSSSSSSFIATMAGSLHSHHVTSLVETFTIDKFQTFQSLPLFFQKNSKTFQFSDIQGLGWP